MRIVRYSAVIVAVALVGAALVIACDAQAADVAGIVLLGSAAVAAVAAVFLEVGLSEDRARERELAEKQRRDRG